MRPADVKEKVQDRIWAKLYGNNMHRSQKQSSVGRFARISKLKGVFEKCYILNWSEEHFHMNKRIPKRKQVYKLTDDMGDDIKGEFYDEELQPIEQNRY